MSITDPAGPDARHMLLSIAHEFLPGRENEDARRQLVHKMLTIIVPLVGQESRREAARVHGILNLQRDTYDQRTAEVVALRTALRRYLPGCEGDGGVAAQNAMRSTNWTAPGHVPARLEEPDGGYDVEIIGHGAADGLAEAARVPAGTQGEAIDMLASEFVRGDIEGASYTIEVRRSPTEDQDDGPGPLAPPVDPPGQPPDASELARRLGGGQLDRP